MPALLLAALSLAAPSPSLLHQAGGVNHALRQRVEITANRLGGRQVETVAQLNAVLEAHPNAIGYVRDSAFTIDPARPEPVRVRSNRSLVLDGATTIRCEVRWDHGLG